MELSNNVHAASLELNGAMANDHPGLNNMDIDMDIDLGLDLEATVTEAEAMAPVCLSPCLCASKNPN